jgi:quinol monooxygenase YgiN
MLVIAGTISIDPAKRDKAAEAATWMMTETHKEPGNLAYSFSGDFADPGLIYIFEKWESQEALDAHFAAPHMAKFQEMMGGFGVRNVSVEKFEIASVGPVR